MSKTPAPDRITLTFDLHDLPTVQHRAGLAGLLLQIESMGEQGNRRAEKLIPDIDEEKLTAVLGYRVFDRCSVEFGDRDTVKPPSWMASHPPTRNSPT